MKDFRHDMTKEEVNEYPLFRYDGEIVVVRDNDGLSRAVSRMKEERVLGFDTESKPTFAKGKINLPSLVQIACSDVVFLIQLRWVPLGEPLIGVLENPRLIKTGVAIRDDMRMLQHLQPFKEDGIIDLGEAARQSEVRLQGLRGLAANFLGVRISKGAQCSNWSVRDLSEQQIAYAATDAWVSRKVFLRMHELELIAF